MYIVGFSMELLLTMHGLYTLVSQNLLIDYLSYMSGMTSDLYADSMRESVFSLEVRWISCETKTPIFFAFESTPTCPSLLLVR